ncbi:type II toxin-antitoxin system prevent-host-death family antitoxin [Micromonospora sp. WMMD998]|uniref:type II toxin-antitoxin system Phd/YefM family antitoxin n=1 Tax=Micromonospora sp. WMMD998 TaxID=3016092 RepID=UPI00249A5D5D|nr:type II toxin-antitoxin system prevent-host-death family antitoxin [Micromonospora sp. WMMD998]WFE38151.1 type II toxin-antitoxin system prevent-host-death family antitoxin [Micromonospora sp. WMMD998]
MHEIGLREMRQNASDLVRRAQAGERVTITVAGRPAAVLGPVSPRTWRAWDDLAGLFDQPTDPGWAEDRGLIDGTVVDPWDQR